VVAREVTKIHEEFVCAEHWLELRDAAKERAPRGEITLMTWSAGRRSIARCSPAVSLKQRVSQLEAEMGLDRKAALKQAARERGLGKRDCVQATFAGTIVLWKLF